MRFEDAKVGMRVVCTSQKDADFKKGTIYTIKRLNADGSPWDLLLKKTESDGGTWGGIRFL